MTNTRITIAAGVTIEEVAEDFMVMVPGATDVLRVSGDAADAIRQIKAGKVVQPSGDTIAHLKDLGVLVDTPGMSRRGLLTVGAAGVGAGISVLALPSVAAASSPGGGGTSGGGGALVGKFFGPSPFGLEIVSQDNSANWPFQLGDTVPPLTDLRQQTGDVAFTGVVNPDPTTVQTSGPGLSARWRVDVGNVGNSADVFLGPGNPVTGTFEFGGATYTVTFTST